MASRIHTGKIAWSIDLSADSDYTPESRLHVGQRLEQSANTRRLLDLFDQYQIPATWFVDEAASETPLSNITSRTAGHEVAVSFGQRVVNGPKRQLATALCRSTFAMQKLQHSLRAVQFPSPPSNEQYELLLKNGISVVRICSGSVGRGADANIRPIRHGLWTLPSPVAVTGGHWPGSIRAWWLATAAVLSAAEERRHCHLALDPATLSPRSLGWPLLAKLLRVQSGLRREGRLEIATVSALVERLMSKQHSGVGARSILRAA
ncbi:MAG: hypothetical protein SGJ20_11390 [Planctomycetota bacterium]|nr:hypothetical protein [Planctomycetota bacterium]